MIIEYSFDPAFTALIEDMYEKYPEELLKLEGIHPDQLDINQTTRAFFRLNKEGKNTAEVSIDANANVAGRDTITYAYDRSALYLENVENVTLYDCRFYQLPAKAIQAQGVVRGLTLEACSFENLGGNGNKHPHPCHF